MNHYQNLSNINRTLTTRCFTKIVVFFLLFWGSATFAQTNYQKDFSAFWTDINTHYAYLDQQAINWEKVREIYEPKTENITTDEEFIRFLETVLNELYNGHSSLNSNLMSSNRLIPSGSDLYIEKVGNKYVIKDIRKGFGADLSGLKTGMEVKLYNGKPIEDQLKKFLPKFTDTPNQKMVQYAGNG